MDNIFIKNNLRNFRRDRKMTQEEIALRINMSLTAYRDLERGNTAIINNNIPKIAEILGTSVEELLLGYRPDADQYPVINEMQSEYGGKITVLEQRICDLEKLVLSLEETIRSKNEIIEMLRKSK